MVFHGRETRVFRPQQAHGGACGGLFLVLLAGLAGMPGCASSNTQRDARGNFATVLTQDIPEEEALDEVATTDAAKLPEALSPEPEELEDEGEPDVKLTEEAKEAIDGIEKEILAEEASIGDEGMGPQKPVPAGKIPLEINRRVREWIYYFSVADRERFQSFLNRGAYYRPIVEDILARNGVPADLYYLAMIESGYLAHARSRVSAVGFWQFMRPTGREYGLRVSQGVDERRDIIRSTEAAAKYLKWLHKRLGSWYLAIAAYNGGPGRVGGAIRRGGSHDFWELARKRVLPTETRQYVPKFLAVVLIGKNPGKYGFKIEPAGPLGSSFPAVEKIFARPGDRLTSLARARRVEVQQLAALNPHLVTQRVPAGGRPYPIWVPARDESVEPPHVQLVHRTVASAPQRSPRRVSRGRIHVVRRGEHLTAISRRYGVSLPDLRRCNRLRGNTIFRGQKLRIPRS
jgi:membrane-bound lytic murein transglycosylase D